MLPGLVLLAALSPSAPAGVADDPVHGFLTAHCAACHTGGKKQGKFSLDGLDPAAVGKDAAAWKRVAERIDAGDMPPDDRPRPDPAAARDVTRHLADALRAAGADPGPVGAGPTGPHLDHDLLFNGRAAVPLDNPPRLWRFSPQIYATWVLKRDGPWDPRGQAMTPAGGDGFRDRAANLTVDSGVLGVVLKNAQEVAAARTAHAVENGAVVPAKGVSGAVAAVLAAPDPTHAQVERAIGEFAFYQRYGRLPADDLARLVGLYNRSCAAAGGDRAAGLRAAFIALQLRPEALFRLELGLGPPDAAGRRMLAPRELAYALSFALGDRLDRPLADAAEAGKLATRADVEREARRLLARPARDNPRVLRFFQEYFGYTAAPDVFKDAAPDHNGRVLVDDTDRLVLSVLADDRDVFRTLLTTNRSFVGAGVPPHARASDGKFSRGRVYRSYGLTDWPETQPVELPAAERAGVLTQPSWLVAMSGNFDNHPVQRGKWVREKLLGGMIPPVPITVNAQVPDDDTRTLRDRLTAITAPEFCAQCHARMNPLGLPFERFDHFGRVRTAVSVADPSKPPTPPKKKGDEPVPARRDVPVDATGAVDRSGDPSADGPVDDPVAMIKRLADSARVRQVFVRHAFRYWMGRDENPGDAPTLVAADRAYVESGGSMTALLLSLLTSDSFLLRTPPPGGSP